MADRITFIVRGLPVPQGSARGYYHAGHVAITSDNRNLSAWRRLVSDVAQHHAPPALWEGPVTVLLEFRLPQPKSRPSFRGRGKERHPIIIYPDRKPDLDKLVRACLDSLTNVILRDDAQVVRLAASKGYGVPGVRVSVARITDGEPAARSP